MEFYRIADLTRVWIIADILEDEAQWFRPGAKVQASVRELGKTLYATVGTTPPVFDQTSRTLRLRLEAENPRLELRPGMFVDLEFTAPAPAGLSVPEEAVLDSGLQKLVYRKTSDGVFEPVPVQIGVAYANRVVITKGLNEGDLVVTSGNFLVDSESRMHASPPVHIANTGAGVGPTQDLATSPRDPVCGMILDQKGAHVRQYTEQFQGSTYNFCSDKCREKFHHDPSRYLDDALSSTARSSEAISALAN
jgi:YHS domain-containing protein